MDPEIFERVAAKDRVEYAASDAEINAAMLTHEATYRLSVRDSIRSQCLSLAHDPSKPASEIVARAAEYLKFIEQPLNAIAE